MIVTVPFPHVGHEVLLLCDHRATLRGRFGLYLWIRERLWLSGAKEC